MMKAFSQRISSFGETVFATFSRMAKELGAVNLGQGFPDFPPPDFALKALSNAVQGYQQYAPLFGMPELMSTLAQSYSPRFQRDLNPSHILITVGATEALFASIQALIDIGDEVILLEPFYDAYPADVIMAGGIPRYVPLRPDESGQWQLDLEELTKAFNHKTKAIILNSPHNPSGKVFSAQELDAIVNLAESYDAYIISDEVYERIAFKPHISIASRPGAWERTLTISSVGKTFSVTGWKIGWLIAPELIVKNVCKAHQWVPFVVATPLQQPAPK
ncbi:MAG: aminotransferase class I/II-fold pyridoxal phosphate-dependent enzyme [Deinococcales bacterium]